MTAPGTSTCEPWATIADLGSPCDDYAIDSVLVEDALQVASDVLYNLTGRQWPGECSDVIRPCGFRQRATRHGGYGWQGGCGCLRTDGCGCRRLSELRLPGVVAGVTQVTIDGAVLDPDRYRVDDWRTLVYLPESDDAERQGWPCCQRLDLPDTEVDTWSVEYVYGQGPPPGGIAAAASLGCQLSLARQPETVGQCRLPKRVTSVVRQGVSMTLLDPLTLFSEGRTGLEDVDLWLASVMVGNSRRPATVWRPDLRKQSTRHVGT